jgi:hypothetical protein
MKKALFGAIAALYTVSAAQAGTFTPGSNDLFIGFQESGVSNNDYLLDAGPVSIYQNASAAFVLNTGLSSLGGTNIGSIGTDLSGSTVFGSTWYTNASTEVGAIGLSSSVTNGLYFTAPAASTAPSVLANSAQRSAAQGVGNASLPGTLVNAYAGENVTANSPVGVIQSTGSSSSWASYLPPTATASFTSLPDIQANFGSGVAGAGLDLYFAAPSSLTPKPSAVLVGEFTFDSAGDITFTPVPEPSSLAILGAGAAVLGLIRRRRA